VARILLVDDSASVRAVLRRFLARTEDMEVVGEAVDGAQAVTLVLERHPDVVLLDLLMPVMDGYTAIERIMALRPTPIVVLSSRANRNQMQTAFEAIRRGAVEVLPKPEDTASWEQLAESLPQVLRTMAEAQPRPSAPGPRRPLRDRALIEATSDVRWIVIGASTGGPSALRDFLEEIPVGSPVSLLVVQHIALGFEVGLAEWLNKELDLDVRLAVDGELPPLGSVRLAPGGAHLRVRPDGSLHLDPDSPPRCGHRPSIDELFLSCAQADGRRVAGVLLTGMGSDGVDGLLALRDAGAVTVVQDEASSVVFGMPRVALERGAATIAGAPRELARGLVRLWRREPA
jgi:two-component system chemotaxis response regulator CheB